MCMETQGVCRWVHGDPRSMHVCAWKPREFAGVCMEVQGVHVCAWRSLHAHSQTLTDHTICRCMCYRGACDSIRCFNAPLSWQLGWSNPITTLDEKMLLPGVAQSFGLPATQLADTNFVQIVPRWMSAPGIPVFYISYR